MSKGKKKQAGVRHFGGKPYIAVPGNYKKKETARNKAKWAKRKRGAEGTRVVKRKDKGKAVYRVYAHYSFMKD